MLSQTAVPVNRSPRSGWGAAYVTVRADGQLYRWYRHTGTQGYTSQDAFLTADAATQAAQSIARCYGVQFKEVRNG